MSERPGTPDDIKNSIKSGNINHLRNAGKKGAEKTNRIKDIKQTLFELHEEERKLQVLEDELARRRSTNEDLISADGEDFEVSNDDRYDEYRIGPRL